MKLLIATLLVLVACSGRPKREKFPGSEGATVGFSDKASSRAVLGGFDPMKDKIPVEEQAIAAKAVLIAKGKISLSKNIKVSKSSTLFLALRDLDTPRPVAAKKIPGAKFPYQYKMSSQDLLGNSRLNPKIKYILKVRIDQDGDPLTYDDGDGIFEQEISIGAKLDIVVSEVY